MWHFCGNLINRLPRWLCFRHPNLSFLSNGNHPLWKLFSVPPQKNSQVKHRTCFVARSMRVSWLFSSKTTFTTPAFFTHHSEFLFDPFKNFGNCMWTGCLHKCLWFSRKLTWNCEQMQFISCVHKKLRQELATYAISVGAHLWNALVDSCQTKRITFDLVYISHHLDWAEKCVPFYKLIFR